MRNPLLLHSVLSAAFLSLPALAQAVPVGAPASQSRHRQSASLTVRLQTVVVTAMRQSTAINIERTPASMVAISGAALNENGDISMENVLGNVPGVVVQGQAKGFVPAIRGIGSDLPPGSGAGAVATNFDGVYDIRAEGAVLGYYDLSRVEVLRGPQGTLYGHNATAGVVNVISNDPVQKLEAGGTLEYGSYHRLGASGMINIPLSHDLAARAAFITMNQDGYLSNGQDDNVGSAGRLKVLYAPNTSFSLLLGGEFTKLGGKGMGAVPQFVTPPKHPYVATDPPNDYNHYNGYKIWANLKWNVGIGILTALPAYQHAMDSEYGFFGGHGNAGSDPDGLSQRSVEVRLNSLPGSKATWDVGYYHYGYQEKVDGYQLSYASGVYSVSPPYNFSYYRAHSDAIYGEITYPVTKIVSLNLGLRETRNWKFSSGTSPFGTIVNGTVSSNHLDYKLGIDADLSRDSFAYASVTTGYRGGGTNPADGSPFGPEKLTSYEIGVKNQLLQKRAQLNADFYYYNYQDYQATDFYIGPTGPNIIFSNVSKVRNYGVEVQGKALVTQSDLVTLSASYLRANFLSPVFFHVNPFAPALNEEGHVLPHSPKWTVVGTFQHMFNLGYRGVIQPRATIRYTSSEYVGPIETPITLQSSYWNEDLSITYRPTEAHWSVTIYGHNLSDQVIKTNNLANFTTLAPPRMFGITLSATVGQ